MNLRKWYALKDTGDVVYLGEHADFFAADDATAGKFNYVWLFDEAEWSRWTEQMREQTPTTSTEPTNDR